MSTRISTADAKDQFNDLLSRVTHHKERIILTRRDNEIAAIIPIEDLTLLIESQDRHDLEDATEALKQAREQGCVSLEEFMDKAG